MKNLLKSMKTTVSKVDPMSARMQGNLEAENLEPEKRLRQEQQVRRGGHTN